MPTFLHTPLLWGLLLAGVPVLIHLINLMHQRRVRWAAMEFLLASQRKNRTWVRLKELLLLAMRMAAIALVVLIVAQPLLRNELGAMLGGTKTHHVVLLDDSFSMSDRRDGGAAMDGAKGVVDRIGAMAAERFDPQTFTLLRFSRAARAAGRPEPDLHHDRVDGEFLGRLRTLLKSVDCSASAAGPEAAIRAVGRLLGAAGDENAMVYIVSDFRAKDWDRAEALRGRLAELADKNATIHLVNCVDREHSNLAITKLEAISGTRAAGISIMMEVEARNFGAEPARNVAVVLDEEGHARPAVKIREIPPGGASRERFQVSFAAAGSHGLAARLDGDAVALDNTRYAVVDVALEVPVLVIDGTMEGRGALFLSSALAPGGTARTGIQPRVEPPSFLNAHPLDDFQAIYLSDVEHLDAPAIDALERFAAGGGGVAWFVGPGTRAGFVNESLWRDGKGLFPVPVTGEKELPVDRLEKVPDVEAADHPVFRILAGRDNSFLSTINVSRYFGVPAEWRPAADSAALVIARLRNGAPLVVERPLGKGRVIAWLTTAAPMWNNAGANPSFPVIIQEMQAYLSGRPDSAASPVVGSPLELAFDPGRYQAGVRFLAPGQERVDGATVESVSAADGSLRAVFPRTEKAGVYEAQLLSAGGAAEVRRYAVNVDPREGDLARLDAAGLSDRLAGVKYTYHQSDAFEADRHELAGYDLSDALLYLLVALLVGEQIFAWSCSYHPGRTEKSLSPSAGGVR